MSLNSSDHVGTSILPAVLRAISHRWSTFTNGVDLQEIGGRWYIGDTPRSAMHLLEVATGSGAPLP